MSRIWVINPNTTRAMTSKIEDCAMAVVGSGVSVNGITSEIGPESIERSRTSAPGASGNFTYTFTLNSPLTLPSNVLGVEISLLNDTFDAFSTDMNGRFTTAAPTVGTSPGFVWSDVNQDGVFPGSEQTRFGQGAANIRFSMTGSAPAPDQRTSPAAMSSSSMAGW